MITEIEINGSKRLAVMYDCSLNVDESKILITRLKDAVLEILMYSCESKKHICELPYNIPYGLCSLLGYLGTDELGNFKNSTIATINGVKHFFICFDNDPDDIRRFRDAILGALTHYGNDPQSSGDLPGDVLNALFIFLDAIKVPSYENISIDYFADTPYNDNDWN